MKKLLLTFALFVLNSYAWEYTYFTTQGPRHCFQGQVCWYTTKAYNSNTFAITGWTNDSRIVTGAAGTNAALPTGTGVWLGKAVGSAFPNTINWTTNYTKCNSTGEDFFLAMQMFDNTNCTSLTTSDLFTYYPTGHGASGTWYVGDPDSDRGAGSTVELVTVSLPSGVTVGGTHHGTSYVVQIDNGSTWANASTVGGHPATTTTPRPFIIPLVVDASATPGSYTVEFDLHCTTTTAECPATDQRVEIPFEIVARPAIPITPPNPIVPIDPTDKATLISRINTGLTAYCTKATGAINYSTPGFPAWTTLMLSSAGEQQIWYYNAGWIYYMWAQYTGDTDWNKCGDRLAADYGYATMTLGGSNQTQRQIQDGLKRLCSTCNLIGKNAITMQGDGVAGLGNVNLTRATQTYDHGIRENFYALNWQITQGKLQDGSATYAQLLVRNPTRAALVAKSASTLMSLLMAETAPGIDYDQMQTFFVGLANHILINYAMYNTDPDNVQLILSVIKNNVDLMQNDLYNLSATLPNEISWKRGAAMWTNSLAVSYGPNCAGNCGGVNGRQSELLGYMFLEGWAYVYAMTGDTAYQVFGDALMKTVADTYASNTDGKKVSEMSQAIYYLTMRDFLTNYLP
jgi:hypothetical protein